MKICMPEEAEKALAVLDGNGFEAYLAGGCVRDSLLGFSPQDWDITTNATPEQIKICFCDYHTIETGVKHGTVTVIIDGIFIEITTFRLDGDYSDHRRPDSVVFTDSLMADLSRRDFTINALAYNNERDLVDYFCGQKDLESRRISCVGDAVTRFSEDALRILRAVRFAATLGFEIDEKTRIAMNKCVALIDFVSAERIAAELNKALQGAEFANILSRNATIFTQVIPELAPMIGFEQHTPYHHLDVWNHTVQAVRSAPDDLILRMTMLLHDIGKPDTFTLDEQGIGHFYGHAGAGAEIADIILSRLRYDNATRKQIVYLIEHHCDMIKPEAKLIKRALNKMGEETLRRLIEVKRADCRAQADKYLGQREENLDETICLLDEIILEKQAFCLRDLEINGEDLLELGFKPGKNLGDALQIILHAVIDGQIKNVREELTAFAKGLISLY